MPSAPFPFSELFRKSVSISLHLWKPLFLGFLLYGLVAGVVAMSVGVTLMGSAVPFSEGQVPSLNPATMVAFFVMFALLFVLGLAFNVGVLDLAVERSPRLRDTLKRIPKLMSPYLSAVFWVFIRSWTWVPFVFGVLMLVLSSGDSTFGELGFLIAVIGFVACGLIFGPRVMFGQIIFIREKVSGLQSVKLSEQRTNRYWGKILGNWLLLSIIVMVLYVGMQLLFGGALGGLTHADQNAGSLVAILTAGGLGFIAMIIVSPFLALLPLVFMTELHDTIKANPRT